MSQSVKIIDLTRSYAVLDPNAFPENLMYTQAEDSPDKEPPIVAFEGYNFLPTAYGYRSYFGINSLLNIAALAQNCDELFVYQFATYENVLVALCDTGIFTASAFTTSAPWTQQVVLTPPGAGLHKNWTYCLIENTLYMYRQGDSLVYTIAPTGINPTTKVVTVGNIAPTFLTMAGQMGIFRANTRLGFWDSANSISWSDLNNKADFVPAPEKLNGNATFSAILGRVVNILPQGTGFVVYTTKGIVGVRYVPQENMIWDASQITDLAGIAYPFQVSRGLTDLEHFAFTNSGIKRIGSYNAASRSHQVEDVLTDVYDYLKEIRDLIALKLVGGRFLYFLTTDTDYINGKTSFVFNTIDSLPVRILVDDTVWNSIDVLPAKVGSIPIENHIGSQLLAGATIGMYTIWRGTGRSMYPSIVTPTSSPYNRNTALVPYVLGSNSAHVPNTGLDLSSTFANANNYANASLITILTNCTPENAVAYLSGSWTYHGLNNIGVAYLGLSDGYLNEMVATQVQEWADFITIQTNNYNAIAAIPNYVAPTVQGSDRFGSTTAANEKLALLVAAGGGSGNSYVVSDTPLGSFLSGAGSTGVGVITGVGTNAAAYSITRTFSGGWDVIKRVTRTFSVVAAEVLWEGRFQYINTYYNGASVERIPCLSGNDPNVRHAGAGGASSYVWIYKYSANIADVDFSTTANQVIAENLFWAASLTTFPLSTIGGNYNTYSRHLNGINLRWLYDYPYVGNYVQSIANSAFSPVQVQTYRVDYTDTTSIVLTANGGLSGSSTMIADQYNLKWAHIPVGAPAGNFTSSYGAISIPGTEIQGTTLAPLDLNITYPGATHLMQNASIGPIYPTYVGALVLDLNLKKWGKCKASFKQIVDYSPLNSSTEPVTYTNFGMDAAILEADGQIRLFDALPADSWMRYGKIGYYRLGMTQALEIKVHFRSSSSGTLTIDSSFDGRALELTQQQVWNFSSVADSTFYTDKVGRWHTVKVSGNFDLTYLEFRGKLRSRR